MPDEPGGSDVVHVKNVDAFPLAVRDLGTAATNFHTDMAEVGKVSASPGAEGGTAESKEFMKLERTARDLLANFMTAVANGLDGYHQAGQKLMQEHEGLVHLTRSRLQTLLRPSEGPVRTDPAFDWRRAVEDQLKNHPGGS
jgi:hypothetical protein